MNAGLLVFILLLALSFLGIPIYIALGIGTLVALNMADLPMLVLPQKLFAGMNSSSLLAIPFFILAGNLMSRSITGKLIDVANALIGRIKGSLALVTIVASGLFGAISGSGVATASAIGGLTIPAMKKEGYPAPFAVAVSSVSSILGPIIPPSITLIVYASITNVSVSKLFIGSVIPGLMLVLCLMGYALVYAKRHDLPAHEKMPAKEVARTFKSGIWALLMPVIILGGIFGGIFTATEAAAVAVVYALVVSLFIYKDTKWSELPGSFVEASVSTATIMVMVGLSKASSYVVVTSGLPALLLDTFSSLTESRVLILLLLNLLFLIIGMLMEASGHHHDDPHPDAPADAVRHQSADVRHCDELQPVHRPGDAAGGPVPAAEQPDRRDQPDQVPEGADAHAADQHLRAAADHLCGSADHLAAVPAEEVKKLKSVLSTAPACSASPPGGGASGGSAERTKEYKGDVTHEDRFSGPGRYGSAHGEKPAEKERLRGSGLRRGQGPA